MTTSHIHFLPQAGAHLFQVCKNHGEFLAYLVQKKYTYQDGQRPIDFHKPHHKIFYLKGLSFVSCMNESTPDFMLIYIFLVPVTHQNCRVKWIASSSSNNFFFWMDDHAKISRFMSAASRETKLNHEFPVASQQVSYVVITVSVYFILCVLILQVFSSLTFSSLALRWC